jgi:23S rRNA pseudouridine955/2504/2580 synthase
MIEFTVEGDAAGLRLDKFLRKKLAGVPVSHLFKMIRTKKIRVNGKRAQPEQPLQAGDAVAVRGAEDRLLSTARPTKKTLPALDLSKLEVLFEDQWLMAINKPAGMAVHPGSGISGGTLVDYVRAYLGPNAVRNDFAASPAHRLDRDTSGVVLVAKRRPAMVHFTDAFTHGKVKKKYLTMVKGKMPQATGTIDIGLNEHQQTARSKALHGVKVQEARTRYKVARQARECAFLECQIETGRTHQIRRHLVAIGHPVAGDRKYGDFAFNRLAKARWGLQRLFLHAEKIEFSHPQDRRLIRIEAQLPVELSEVWNRAAQEV